MAGPPAARRTLTIIAVLALTVMTLGGCTSSLSDMQLSDLVPDFHSSSGSHSGSGLGFTVFQGAPQAPDQRKITAADLVAPNGTCQAGAVEASATAGSGKPTTTGSGSATAASNANTAAAAESIPFAKPASDIGLMMTECQVVAAAGRPDQVTIGADKAGDRKTVLTYNKGDHAGVYTFVSGRLKVIDALPTPAKREPRRHPRRRRHARGAGHESVS